MPYCPNCGHRIDDPGARFCSSCGRDVTVLFASQPGPQGQSTVVSVVSKQEASATSYASLGERFVAVLIDMILLAVIVAVVSIPFGIMAWVGALFASPITAAFNGLFFSAIWFVAWVVYFTHYESTSGQTIGKRAMSIRVVDQSTGSTVDTGRAFVRSILRIVDWLPVLYLVGFVLVLATQRRQRLGDMAARTVVVRSR